MNAILRAQVVGIRCTTADYITTPDNASGTGRKIFHQHQQVPSSVSGSPLNKTASLYLSSAFTGEADVIRQPQ